MDLRTNMMLLKAARTDFILLGLLTLLFYLCKMPLVAIVVCFILCCAGLLVEVAHGLYLIWCSLTMRASHRINERTGLLVTCSDLEAQSTHYNSSENTSLSLRRSSPLPIPRRRSIEHNVEFGPCLSSRTWMASLPWMASSLVPWYLDWRRKHVTHGRRYTVSESVTINQLSETPKTSRNHTLSESAVQDFEVT